MRKWSERCTKRGEGLLQHIKVVYHGNQLGELELEVDGDGFADVADRPHQLVVV